MFTTIASQANTRQHSLVQLTAPVPNSKDALERSASGKTSKPRPSFTSLLLKALGAFPV